MLINMWYVVGSSAELAPGTSKPLRMIGHDFVLFRDSDGKGHCLSDICVHRGGSLCRGGVVNDTVQCPYHGWRFTGEGQCVEIPSLGPDASIPKRARVDSYPVAEKYGWIWVFAGDLPESERPPLPDHDFFPEYKSNEYRITRGSYLFNVNWMRAIDNILDPAHPFHVHSDFGHFEDQRLKRFEVEQHGTATLSKHQFKSMPKRGEWREGMADERPDTLNQIQFNMTGMIFRNDIHPSPGMHHMVFSAYLPVEEDKVLNTWIHARNFFVDEKYDADTIRRNYAVLQEDAVVLNHVAPLKSPRNFTNELFIESDIHIAAFRKKVRALEEKGWALDLKASDQDDLARAIPSPKRTDDPKNWVLEPASVRHFKKQQAAE